MWAFSYFLSNLGNYIDEFLANKVLVSLVLAIPVVIVGYNYWLSYQADAAMVFDNAEKRCEHWFEGDYGENGPVKIFGAWKKNNKVVVELGYYDVRGFRTKLCVYDPDTFRLYSPGASEIAYWRP